MTFRNLYLNLNRPEYLPSVEVILSDLIWQAVEIDATAWLDHSSGAKGSPIDGLPLGLVYESLTKKQPKDLTIVASRSRSEAEEWLSQLLDSGFQVSGKLEAKILAESILNSLRAPKAQDAKSRSAAPFTPAIALLQNNAGISAKKNPANWAHIVEKMYRLGATAPTCESSVTIRLLTAMNQLLSQDNLLRATDHFIQNSLLPHEVSEKLREINSAPYEYFQLDSSIAEMAPISGSFTLCPFQWFHNSWNSLTAQNWSRALSSRRWLAWATTVLRAGIGFGYLWEARWYEVLSREVIDLSIDAQRTPKTHDALLRETMRAPLAVWLSSESPVPDRDVSSRLKKLVERGNGLEAVFREFFRETERSDPSLLRESVEKGLKILSENQVFVQKLQTVWSGDNPEKSKRTWETIKYSLMTRASDSEQLGEEFNQQRDYYGLFRPYKNSRYLFVDPSTEWIAVVASLVRDDPAKTVTLKPVRDAMNALGLQPSVDVLTACLEDAGLARSAPDADTGIKVASAFGAR